MQRWQNKVAVVTGASSGIGAAIVKDLINADLIVVGLARRVERVEALKQEVPRGKRQNLYAVKCDVSSLTSVTAAFNWIEKNLDGVDILVNNAGILQFGHLVTKDLGEIAQVLHTNVMGVVCCTQRAYNSMRQRNFDGHVVLINSIAGHRVLKMCSNIYASSKYAISAMTEVYRQEFQELNTKIKVTSISPGLVDTELLTDEAKAQVGEAILKPEDISQGVLFAISTPPHVQIHEMIIKPLGEVI